ncbi:hypothetical protein, partial [Calothrix rhizosoleniae]|uniref:hypothetical protein n=1 Tax=Calothrix rhizosoleniae TaxID=888997 RepID=UPI001356351F
SPAQPPNTIIEPPVESKQKIKLIPKQTSNNSIKGWQIITIIIAIIIGFFIGMNLNPEPSPTNNENNKISTRNI